MEGKDVDPIKKPIDKINPSDNNTAMNFGGSNETQEDNSALIKENEALKAEIKDLNEKLVAQKLENEGLMAKNMEQVGKIEELTTSNNDLNAKITEFEAKLAA